MPQPTTFFIYNASAGSGKTFTLVKHYLKLLFQSQKKLPFKHILALTFTNKAVGEMKERIFKHLTEFANPEILDNKNDMCAALCEELGISIEFLHKKSNTLLQEIIHNYAAFEVSTIDKFNHRVIRTFAHDLKLSVNFEVEIDQQSMLMEAVDSLISKAGEDKLLTEVLVSFALEKADEDKSFDVSLDFYNIAKLLATENDAPFIETIKDKTLADFNILKSQLIKQRQLAEKSAIEATNLFFELLAEHQLDSNHFFGSYLPKFLKRIQDNNFEVKFEETKWQREIATQPLYTKSQKEPIKAIIDNLQPQIVELYNLIKEKITLRKFLNAIYKNITPLSVLNAINNELNNLKEEQNKVLISEFNSIINKEIKSQPSPYIYERLGEKFFHYCIDEFQDTSVLQWENLTPLVSNALSQEKMGERGSLLLVGDAKQAIYRWRGGKAEQFIDLYNTTANPFQIEAAVFQLPVNYRSYKTIVEFNNSFFQYLSGFALSESVYAELYQNAHQKHHSEKDGYVEISFIDASDEENERDIYAQQTFLKIKDCIETGYQLSDICVLVRKNKDAVTISEYLNQQGVTVVSSESLLLKNSAEVGFIINLLKYTSAPENYESKIEILAYLSKNLGLEDSHAFYKSYLALPFESFFKKLNEFNFYLNPSVFSQLSLYELVESLIQSFKLIKTSNAYLQFLLDEILSFSEKQNAHLSKFIDYFETKKETLSISSPESQDAVRVMTIHKAKGLEFEIVIFPFADTDVHKTIGDKVWFPLNPEKFNGFEMAYLNLNADLQGFGPIGANLYNQQRAQKALDGVNVLYVALTRAVGQLYIISKIKKGEDHYSGYFMSYLTSENLWQEGKLSYALGTPPRPSVQQTLTVKNLQPNFISTNISELNLGIVDNASYLWNSTIKNAIESGNLIHDVMSNIKTLQDIESVLEEFKTIGKIEPTQTETLQQIVTSIVTHPQLASYFKPGLTVYNEKEIITSSGTILRPDRIVIPSDNNAVIIDYKTGHLSEQHKHQINEYGMALNDLGFEIGSKILVYVNNDIDIVTI